MADWRSTWRKSSSTALQFSQFPFELGKFGDCILHLLDVQPLVSNLKHCRTVGHSFTNIRMTWIARPRGARRCKIFQCYNALSASAEIASVLFFETSHWRQDSDDSVLPAEAEASHKKSLHHLVPTIFWVYPSEGLLTFLSELLMQKWYLKLSFSSLLTSHSYIPFTFWPLYLSCCGWGLTDFAISPGRRHPFSNRSPRLTPAVRMRIPKPSKREWTRRFQGHGPLHARMKSYDIPDMPRLSGLMNLPEDVHWMQVLEENSRLRSENEALRV